MQAINDDHALWTAKSVLKKGTTILPCCLNIKVTNGGRV